MKSLIPSYAGENSVSGNGEGRQRNQEKKIQEVPLYSGPVKVFAIPPFWASSKKALLRANTKPPVELNIINLRKKWKGICSQVPFIVLKYRQGCI